MRGGHVESSALGEAGEDEARVGEGKEEGSKGERERGEGKPHFGGMVCLCCERASGRYATIARCFSGLRFVVGDVVELVEIVFRVH